MCILCLSCQSSSQTKNNTSSSSVNEQENVVQTTKITSEEIKVGKFSLKLKDCEFTYVGLGKTANFNFRFPPNCQFSKNAEGEVRIFKSNKAYVLAVESSKKNLNNNDCETYIRGIIITKKAVQLSKQTQKVSMCLPYVWDEKMFITFSSKTVSFK
jgi:hypothetical protein